jgi:hypothetical protein
MNHLKSIGLDGTAVVLIVVEKSYKAKQLNQICISIYSGALPQI